MRLLRPRIRVPKTFDAPYHLFYLIHENEIDKFYGGGDWNHFHNGLLRIIYGWDIGRCLPVTIYHHLWIASASSFDSINSISKSLGGYDLTRLAHRMNNPMDTTTNIKSEFMEYVHHPARHHMNVR